MKLAISIAMVLLCATRVAAANGSQLTLQISLDAKGQLTKDSCKLVVGGATTTDDDELTIKPQGGTLAEDLKLTVGTGQPKTITAAGVSTAQTGIFKTEDLVLAGAKSGASCTIKKPATPDVATQNVAASLVNAQALAAAGPLQIRGHGVSGTKSSGRTFRLYHLPDGTPAFPIPNHISEKDQIEIWIILPEGGAATVDVVACDKVPGFRVEGSYKDAAAGAGALQVAPVFHAVALGTTLQCAGTLTYKISTSGTGANGTTTTSIAIDPVYRFEWGVGYMFDFGAPHALKLGDRPAASGMGNEKFVIDSHDYAGAKPIITLSVDVCGTNPRDLTWCDRLFNPTVWLDPSRLADGFGVGMGIRPMYGLSILAGVTVFKTTKLADGVMVPADGTWATPGDLPTKNVFSKDSLGFALAVSIDTEVFAQIVPHD